MKVLLFLTVVAVALGDDDVVDEDRGDSEYHFAWLHDGGRTYDWQGANSYCSSLGRGWKGISIETREENDFVTDVIEHHELPWVWTGGQRRGRDFVWPSGARFVGLNWSHTGGKKQPQPDNREQGGENCVAVLNDFYDDGVRWHDIACHHEKSIICERDD
ncbi:mannose-binding protein [Penaeus vannamei]|uniref:Mannose-binding protein n=1 Tax=Penaeus vannamei TaxID=6689 RepID=A0A3R7QE82_PENVA|nr:mannose-binding protein [Penaeus vannamei]